MSQKSKTQIVLNVSIEFGEDDEIEIFIKSNCYKESLPQKRFKFNSIL